MKITYTGRQVELAPAQLKKLQGRFAKIGQLLDGREERDAHCQLCEGDAHRGDEGGHQRRDQGGAARRSSVGEADGVAGQQLDHVVLDHDAGSEPFLSESPLDLILEETLDGASEIHDLHL